MAGGALARRFVRSYQRQTVTTIEPGELRWHQAAGCLRALVAVAGTRVGHPWLISGPAFAGRLTTLTGTPVRAR